MVPGSNEYVAWISEWHIEVKSRSKRFPALVFNVPAFSKKTNRHRIKSDRDSVGMDKVKLVRIKIA